MQTFHKYNILTAIVFHAFIRVNHMELQQTAQSEKTVVFFVKHDDAAKCTIINFPTIPTAICKKYASMPKLLVPAITCTAGKKFVIYCFIRMYMCLLSQQICVIVYIQCNYIGSIGIYNKICHFSTIILIRFYCCPIAHTKVMLSR